MITVSPFVIIGLSALLVASLLLAAMLSNHNIARYRRTVLYPENTAVIITEVDRDYRIRYTNADSPEGQFFTYPSRTIFHLIPTDYHQIVRTTFEAVLASKVSESYEYPKASTNGQYEWYRTEIDPIIDRDRITGFRLLTHNITSDKLASLVLEGYNRVLEMLASGTSLNEVLYGISVTVERARPNTLCSIVLLEDGKKLHSIPAPQIPMSFMDAINGLGIGPEEGSCGAAIYRKERVIATDILVHPYWAKYRDIATEAGLRACWSEPIFDSSGNVLGALAMYYRDVRAPNRNDLTFISSVAHLAGIAIENSLARQRLQDSFNSIKRAKQEWESTVDSLANLIALLDKQQHILRTNRAIQNWGNDVRHIKGQPIQKLFPSQDFQTGLQHAWERLNRGETTSFEFIDPGSGADLLAQIHPISTMTHWDEGVSESHAVIVITDITQHKRLEQAQLESQEVRLKLEMDRRVVGMRQDFVSAISHEFRTPLAVIKSSKDILERYQKQLTPERQQVHFQRIDEQVNLMVEMVDQVLFISQTADNRISVRMENIVLDDFCRNILADMDQMSHQSHKLELYPAANPITVCTDARLLRQILGNLISNAIKYSPLGSAVRIKMNHEGSSVAIMVSDQGIGIPLEEQQWLFDAFYRASNVNEIKGTGLGMTVVKNAVDILHGEITFTSQPDEGSTFIVRLPINPMNN